MTAVAPATGTADRVLARVSTEGAKEIPASTAEAKERVQAVEKLAVVVEALVEAEAVVEQAAVQPRESSVGLRSGPRIFVAPNSARHTTSATNATMLAAVTPTTAQSSVTMAMCAMLLLVPTSLRTALSCD